MNSLDEQKLTYTLHVLKSIISNITNETKLIKSHINLIDTNPPIVYTKDILYEQLYLSDFLKNINHQLSALNNYKQF